MSSTTANLTNINFMSENRYDNLSEVHDDELYAVKIDSFDSEQVINQNEDANPVKMWTGTRAEYNAITTKNPDTIYHITDDDNITQSLLETIYPIGAIYIGTMNACPLSVLFGTWEKISSGKVLQSADENHLPGTIIEAGLPNISGEIYGDGFNNAEGIFWQDNSGSLYASKRDTSLTIAQYGSTSSGGKQSIIGVNASRSSSIYGNSNTVQPPAFVVNIWKRTA